MKRTVINNIYIEFDNTTGYSTEAYDMASVLLSNDPYDISDETIKPGKNPEAVQDLFHDWIHNNRQIFNKEKVNRQMQEANIQNTGQSPWEFGPTLSIRVNHTYVNLLWPATTSAIDPNVDLKLEVLKLKQLIEDNIVDIRPKFKYRTLEKDSDYSNIPYLYLDGEKPGPQEQIPRIVKVE